MDLVQEAYARYPHKVRRVAGPAADNARCDDLGCLLDLRRNDRWDMKITDPHAFERSYTLEGKDGEHRPGVIAVLLGRLLPSRPNKGDVWGDVCLSVNAARTK
jgi:hypothetical protein